MANFDFILDVDNLFPEALKDENLSKEMVKAGQEILKTAIQRSARRYRKTGSMANSIKVKAPKVSKNGDVVGSITFSGEDKNGMSNAQKAFWIDYGTKHIDVTAFVRSAGKSSEGAALKAMEQVFNSKMKG